MIRINLAQKKQASYLGGSKTASFVPGASTESGGETMSSLKGLFSGGSDGITSMLTRIFVPAALCIGLYYGYEYYTSQKLAEMAQEAEILTQEKTRIEAELRRIKVFETVKVELERNEAFLRTKIQTIEKLIRGRDFTVKSLVVLSQAIPKEVWLNEIVTTEQGFVFKGGTIEIGFVSDLMSKLGQTIYFKDVKLKSTSTDQNQRQASFELTARRE